MHSKLRMETKQIRDPGATPVGLKIREILLDKTLEMDPIVQTLLFVAARASVVPQIQKHLYVNDVMVLTDRWVYSTHVYQSVMGNISPEAVDELHRTFCANARPSAYVLLDCPVDQAEQRKRLAHVEAGTSEDRFEVKPLEWRTQLRGAYLAVAHKGLNNVPIAIVDGTGSPEIVARRVMTGLIEKCPAFARKIATALHNG